jgi:hypothetical protein
MSNIEFRQVPFPFIEGMSQDTYLESLCEKLQVRVCSTSTQGGCFFDSIYALLPTVGKAVKSSKCLRFQIIQFFRQCIDGEHGDLGERVSEDIRHAMTRPIVSSCRTRVAGNRMKTCEDYFKAISLQSTWAEGYHWLRAVAHLFSVRVSIFIHDFEHDLTFGDSGEIIALWKSDVETHFEPLIPIQCDCTLVHSFHGIIPNPSRSCVSRIAPATLYASGQSCLVLCLLGDLSSRLS